MKKYFLLFILILFTPAAFSQETNEDSLTPSQFAITFNEGAVFGQVTRIEIMETRSNFVRENLLVGGFFNMKTENLWKLDLQLELAAFYPFKTSFNGMQQFPKNPINYAFDGFLGAVYSFDDLQFILIDASLGMHYMYQLSDEYHLNYLGLGLMGTVEFPITKKWTIINNYFVTYDDANLGSNKKVQHFDASYQYRVELGIRYSNKN